MTRARWRTTIAAALVLGLMVGAALSYLFDSTRERREGSSSPRRPLTVDFNGDFETGDYSQWTSVQEEARDRIRIVREPVRQGRFASRHEVRAGDSVASGARAELLWGSSGEPPLREGSEHYFGWSTYFGLNFPSPRPDEGHSLFLQWKDEGRGSPPMEMSARDERITLHTSGGDPWSIPLTRGVWHDFVAHVRFSSDPGVGLVELWHDGDKVLAGFRTATLKPDQSSYLKLGYYRREGFQPTGVLYHDGLRVGSSYEAVVRRGQ